MIRKAFDKAFNPFFASVDSPLSPTGDTTKKPHADQPTPTDPKAALLDKAREIVTGDRRKDYGGALENHDQIASLWRSYLRDRPASDITAEDVAVMMVLVKIARLSTSPAHYDSQVDIAGYAAVMNEIREQRKAQKANP